MNKEKIKEKLTWLRLIFTTVIAIDVACIAWFVSNYNKTNPLILNYDLLIISFLTGSIFTIVGKINANINKLED